jgi:hypothetical protein
MPSNFFEDGVEHLRLEDYFSALDCFQQILLSEPNHFGAELNTGTALNNLGRFEEALPFFQASARKDESVLININLGVCLYRLNRFVEASEHFRKVLTVEPDNALIQYNLAYALLAQGEYSEGWRLFGARKHASLWGDREPYPNRPNWQGQPLADGQTLAIFHEQGFGDTLMLARYLPQVIEKTKNVLLICPPELDSLLKYNYHIATVRHDLRPPTADYQCSMFDLPELCNATFENTPHPSYLRAPPYMVADWRPMLLTLPSRPHVGLVWAGSPHRNSPHVLTDSRRSLAFDQLAPLFEVSNVNFIALQKGEAIWQSRCSDAPLHDWTDRLITFADTAALIANLDLVIAVDTSVVHLAAAMGKPVWLLNRYDSCWRWQPEGRAPWYATVRDFRQHAPGDWDSVIQHICSELHTLDRPNAAVQNGAG